VLGSTASGLAESSRALASFERAVPRPGLVEYARPL